MQIEQYLTLVRENKIQHFVAGSHLTSEKHGQPTSFLPRSDSATLGYVMGNEGEQGLHPLGWLFFLSFVEEQPNKSRYDPDSALVWI